MNDLENCRRILGKTIHMSRNVQWKRSGSWNPEVMVTDPDLDPAPDPNSRVPYVSSRRKKKVYRRNGHDYGIVRKIWL